MPEGEERDRRGEGEREEEEGEKGEGEEEEMREACWSPKMLNPCDPGAVAYWKWFFWKGYFRPVCDFLVMNYKDKSGARIGA